MSRRTLLMVSSLLAALATGAAAADADSEAASASAPVYNVALCCQLCPQAADPQNYAGSTYLEEFSVLQQGRDGWLFRSRVDLSTRIEITDDSLAELRRLASAMRARGTELVVVLQPPRALMDPDKLGDDQRASYDLGAARAGYAQALARIRSAGVTVPPLDTLVDEHKHYEYFFRRDHHWTPAGAEATAKVVAATVQQMPSFREVPRLTYATRANALIGKPGTLQKVASQICGGSYSMQYLTGYITEASSDNAAASADALLGPQPKKSDSPSGGLLDDHAASAGSGGLLDDGDAGGDSGAPQIALIGTSNSDAKGGYNFGGYLQQYIGADILNAALSGGSFDGSLLHYLPSEAYQKHPPKIVIWEMPWQNWPGADKNPYKTFRQALPLVHDGCRERPAVLERQMALKAGDNELLFNAGGKPLQGGRYWLDLQFDDPTIKDLHAIIWYYTGQKESLKLHFNQYVDNGGRFVTELRRNRPDYAAATFMGATLNLEQEPVKPLSVKVRVCSMEGPQQQTATAAEIPNAHSH
ncbi:alginate biosynthesis protein AlgX [Hydrocarboniphaga sp.]|uniref:alginate O-acetyltransferase AlgX-related protein n=1 Tax=Hydrocarboniphaga sp. TaxID=2033016 RepID=UPI0026361BC3|nr:alginate biosynthesis protein AlgX [Hydrocarboniphaga sp.]